MFCLSLSLTFLVFFLLLFLSLVSCCDYVSVFLSLYLSLSLSLHLFCLSVVSSLSPARLFVAAEWQQCTNRGQRLGAPACLGLN